MVDDCAHWAVNFLDVKICLRVQKTCWKTFKCEWWSAHPFKFFEWLGIFGFNDVSWKRRGRKFFVCKFLKVYSFNNDNTGHVNGVLLLKDFFLIVYYLCIFIRCKFGSVLKTQDFYQHLRTKSVNCSIMLYNNYFHINKTKFSRQVFLASTLLVTVQAKRRKNKQNWAKWRPFLSQNQSILVTNIPMVDTISLYWIYNCLTFYDLKSY